nr:equinatoxin 2=pyruvate kinase and sialidase homolog {N-terminal, type b} [Actinia equina=sea anemone, tentacles and bodies, Peptide Partial, 19 aa] [Actinia equina]
SADVAGAVIDGASLSFDIL